MKKETYLSEVVLGEAAGVHDLVHPLRSQEDLRVRLDRLRERLVSDDLRLALEERRESRIIHHRHLLLVAYLSLILARSCFVIFACLFDASCGWSCCIWSEKQIYSCNLGSRVPSIFQA